MDDEIVARAPAVPAAGKFQGQAAFFAARLIPSVLGLITTSMLTRLLEPASYGLYALGLSVVFLMTTGCFEWLGLSLMRLAPTAARNGSFFGTVVSCFLLMAAMAVVANAALVAFEIPANARTFAVGCLVAGIASAWTELKQRLQMAELQTAAYVTTAAVRGVAAIVLVIGAALLEADVPTLMFAVAGANLLAGLVAPDARLSLRRFRFDPAIVRKLMLFGFPLTISVGLSTILISVDKWLLQAFSGAEAVGFFTAATLIAQVPVLTLASCVGPSSYALAVRAVEFGSPAQAREQLSQNLTLLLAIVLPASVGVVAVSDVAARVLLGAPFWEPVDHLAPWLAATALLSAVRAFYVDFAFQLAQKTRPLIWTTALAVVINIVLDIILIPHHGERGAAMGSFIAYAVSITIASIASRRAYPLPVPLWPIAQILAATLIMAGVITMLPQRDAATGLGLRVLVGGLCYSVIIVAFNLLGLRERVISTLARIRLSSAPKS